MKSWQKIKLEEALNYVQPTPYIVQDTQYSDEFEVPVLTAGKSFLLGYTYETNGIYENVPTIIFDDFTTAFKYVDFPFKVKSSAMKMLEVTSDDYDIKFIYYLMQSLNFEAGEHKRYWISKYSQQFIKVPPLPQQKKIAAILDAADAYRQKTKALIAKYDELTQSLFLDMFGDPVANNRKWKVDKLKDLSVKIGSGNTPKGGEKVYVEEGITFFRSMNVWKNNIVYDDIAFIDEETHKKMPKSSLKHKDILMTKTGRVNTENSSLGRAALYLGEDDMANLNGHVYLIRLKKGVLHEFVLHILTSKEYRDLIRRVCVGGIDKRQLNKDHIEDFPIISPPKELQEKFVGNLETIASHKKRLLESLAKAEDLFNSLLRRAFKGELTN
jgi:restriction endonuclease S subunit